LFIDHVFVILVAMVQIYLQSEDYGINNRWLYIIGTFFLIGYPIWLYKLQEAEEPPATDGKTPRAPDATNTNQGTENSSAPSSLRNSDRTDNSVLRTSNRSRSKKQNSTTDLSSSDQPENKRIGKLTPKSVLLWVYLGLIAFFHVVSSLSRVLQQMGELQRCSMGFPNQ